ncbi:MAG TPA: fluoride efflux transporter CrcB [Gemmatimonadales bacterium]|jgi:CrcB protein
MILYIALGGIVGTVSRWYLQGWIQTRSGLTGFPVGTLAINLVGSLILGFVVRLATGSTVITPELRAGLTIGFCGGFTTMSTFAFESVRLLGDGEYWWATMYMGGTIAGSLLAVVVGIAAAERLL